jgi:hypothetical protein
MQRAARAHERRDDAMIARAADASARADTASDDAAHQTAVAIARRRDLEQRRVTLIVRRRIGFARLKSSPSRAAHSFRFGEHRRVLSYDEYVKRRICLDFGARRGASRRLE